MKELFLKLINWYKQNYYSQGDSYYVNMDSSSGIVFVGHANDNELQHGKGKSIRLTWNEVETILKTK